MIKWAIILGISGWLVFGLIVLCAIEEEEKSKNKNVYLILL
jgi:hypothetical protein